MAEVIKLTELAENFTIACALKKEAARLRQHLPDEWNLLVTGLGTDRTLASLETLFEREKPSLLIFTGMAGQLDPEVRLGQFVFPEFWQLESGTTFQILPDLGRGLRQKGWDVDGKGVTVRVPVVRQVDRLALFRRTGARICDMESAAAMMISQSYGVPCLAPKIVSDTSKSGMLAFYRNFQKNVEKLAGNIRRLVETLTAYRS